MYRLLVLCISVPLLAQQQLNYQQAINHAFSAGRKAKILFEQKKITNYSLQAARAGLQPIWSVTGNKSKDESDANLRVQQSFQSGATASLGYDFLHRQNSLTVTQPLLRGLQQPKINLASSEDSYLQTRYTQIKAAQAIVQEVLQAYWQVIQAQKNQKVQILARQASNKLYQQYKIKVDAGLLPRLSLSEQKGQMQRFDLQELKQRTEARKSLERLKLLVNVPRDVDLLLVEDISLDSFGAMPDIKQVIDNIMTKNLDIKTAKIALAQAKRNLKIAANAILPELDVTSSMQHDGANVGVSLSLPLNDPQLKQQIATARTSLKQAKLNYDQIVQDKYILAKNLLLELNSKAKEHQLLAANMANSSHLYSLTRQQYRHGLASSLDVINRQKTLVSDQQAIIYNDISYLSTYVILMAEQNILLQYFRINI